MVTNLDLKHFFTYYQVWHTFYGVLSEGFYTNLPEESAFKKGKMYKLHKALYDLKQESVANIQKKKSWTRNLGKHFALTDLLTCYL